MQGDNKMTKKRFIALDEGYDFIIRDTITHNDLCDVESIIDVLNDYEKENEELKQQLEDITLNWTQNHTNFDKDELYIKDNNTEITLKNNNLLISVCIPQIKEHFKFHYIVTGRRLEREYQYFKR